MRDRLETESEQRSFVPDAFMRSALKSVMQMQAVRKSVTQGGANKGGAGGVSAFGLRWQGTGFQIHQKGELSRRRQQENRSQRLAEEEGRLRILMSGESPDDTMFQHRARLFPLPCLAAVACPSGTSSQRARFRLRLQRTIVAVTNRAICTLNHLYSTPSPSLHIHSRSLSQSQLDNPFSCFCCHLSDHSVQLPP
jgi:hypothetical protein